jgi:uncharacterized protein YndB with AHSA1/START domain
MKSINHATFSLERDYDAPVATVFAAWADPVAKGRWFGAGNEHELDFRIGGFEASRGRHGDGPVLTFESRYHDIVGDERIIYASTLRAGEELATVSITTVEFETVGGGTRLTLTEHDTFLDGREEPSWREQGTSEWLDALAVELGSGR